MLRVAALPNWYPSEKPVKLNYDQETDSLYIDLNARPSVDSVTLKGRGAAHTLPEGTDHEGRLP